MARTTIGANVDPDIKARLIRAVASDGKTVNSVIKELVNNYLDGKDKLDHQTKFTPTKKAEELKTEKLEIIPDDEMVEIEDVGEMSRKEILNEMWDDFVDCAKERGYTLMKTDTLEIILPVLKEVVEEMGKEDFECPECNYTSRSKFNYCPRCGAELTWED